MEKSEKKAAWPFSEPNHIRDVGLRMSQVAAVAAGREAIRLARDVDAGDLPFHRAVAVLAGPLGFSTNLAIAMLGGQSSDVAPPLRVAACILLGERGASMGRDEAKAELAKVLGLCDAKDVPTPSPAIARMPVSKVASLFPGSRLPNSRAWLCASEGNGEGITRIRVMVDEPHSQDSQREMAARMLAVGFLMDVETVDRGGSAPVHVAHATIGPQAWTFWAKPCPAGD